MPLAVAVFVSVFLLTALLIAASGVNASERAKQSLARLNGLLAGHGGAVDETVDVRKRETLSSIPLLDRVLLRLDIAPKLRELFHQANVQWTSDGFLLASVALWIVGAGLFYLKTGTVLFSIAAGLIAAFGPLIYVTRKRARRLLKFEEGLPPALDLMVSGLRGGHSFVSVLGLVAREASDPIGPEFRICFDEQNYGLELRAALQNLADRVPVQDIRIVITAVMVQKETGGNLAEVLEKCGHVIRERFRLKQEVRVKTAQGRLTGWVLSLLPPGLATLLYLVRPDIISLLWLRPLGVKMIYTGIVMVSIGALLIRKIVNIRV